MYVYEADEIDHSASSRSDVTRQRVLSEVQDQGYAEFTELDTT